MADQFSVKKILKGLENNLGEDDYIEPLNILVNALNKNKLNFFGELAFKHQLKRRLKTRKFIYGEFKNNAYQDPADPVFVITNTCLEQPFYSICSIKTRYLRSYLLYWEIMKPLPIAKNKKEIDKRIRKVNESFFLEKL